LHSAHWSGGPRDGGGGEGEWDYYTFSGKGGKGLRRVGFWSHRFMDRFLG
jgi:hypothetical protein